MERPGTRLRRASHVLDDCHRRAGGVVAPDDWAADNKVIRTRRDGLRRGPGPPVIIDGRAGKPDPGCGDQQPLLSREFADPVRIVVRCRDDPVAAGFDRPFYLQLDPGRYTA